MSYQVIARKYRPQKFNDVVGQEHVTQTLGNAIRQNRIAHAYLFVGPRGTGKTTIARIFAKCLNCTDGPKVDFPDNDPRCQEIAEGRSLDVLEIDGASNRGIEEIRELRETVKYAPASARFKIYIIDEVHSLTKDAFNALLKTLEEPPAHVKFMFATTEPEKVLATILSRCQRFDLRRIPVPLIARHLASIADKESVQIDEPALNAIARGADGGMRDAESALDQLISFCGDKITEADVLSMFGLTAQTQIHALAEGILQSNAPAILQEISQLAKSGKDLGRLLPELLHHFRNLLIFHISQGDPNLIEATREQIHALKTQSDLGNPEDLTRIMEVLTEAETRYKDASSKKIFVEVTLLKAIQARQAVPLDHVLQQLQNLRQNTGSTPPSPTAASNAPSSAANPAIQSQPTRKSTAPPADHESTAPAPAQASNLSALWQDLLEALGRVSAFTRSYFLQAHPVALENNVLTIGFDPEFADQMDMVNNTKTLSILQTKLKELGHPKSHVKIVEAPMPDTWSRHAPDPAPDPIQPAPAPTPTPAEDKTQTPKAATAPEPDPAPAVPQKISMDEFKKDPLIQKALDIFKGHIVEIRA